MCCCDRCFRAKYHEISITWLIHQLWIGCPGHRPTYILEMISLISGLQLLVTFSICLTLDIKCIMIWKKLVMDLKKLAEDGFDPSTSGLWAQHAPTAPLCYTCLFHLSVMHLQVICSIVAYIICSECQSTLTVLQPLSLSLLLSLAVTLKNSILLQIIITINIIVI